MHAGLVGVLFGHLGAAKAPVAIGGAEGHEGEGREQKERQHGVVEVEVMLARNAQAHVKHREANACGNRDKLRQAAQKGRCAASAS